MKKATFFAYTLFPLFMLMLLTDCNQKDEMDAGTVDSTYNEINYPRDTITMHGFIGINAFVDDPLDKMKVAGFVREYHTWGWDEGNIYKGNGYVDYPGYPDNEIKWAPGYIKNWNFDHFYTKLNDAGIQVAPCLQKNVPWLFQNTDVPNENKPVDKPGANTTDPDSYEAKAHHLFQYAARYGHAKVDTSLLTLAPDQDKKTGLGLICYLEDWNEQDKDWKGPDAEFSPEEYAAMSSACYDGHGGTMNGGSGTFGIKNADSSMKFVMAGLADLNLDYIKKTEAWYKNNRPDGAFIPDVINLHHYAFDGDGPALSPEEAQFRSRMEKFTTWRNQNHPEVEVWISEFGWDTHPQSRLRPPEIGSFSREEVQGQWLVRAYLAFAAAGVDRAQMYMLRDVNQESSTQFSTCGLTGPKGDWTLKTSWYYVYTMRNALKDMRFYNEQETNDKKVSIYKFKQLKGNKGAYAVWCPTSDDTVKHEYEIELRGNPSKATLVELEKGSTSGRISKLEISNNTVTIDVTERPVFIKVDDIE